MKREQNPLYLIAALLNLALFLAVFLLAGSWHQAIDYRAFYSVGSLANTDLRSVYDGAAQKAALLHYSGETVWIPFYHLPLELLLLGPLARLPYAASLALWSVMSAGFLLAATWLLSAGMRLRWIDVLTMALAMYATEYVFYQGQDTLLLLWVLSAAFFLLQRGRDSAAAVVLALGLFKPQIPAVIALALLLNGRRRFFAVFSGCSVAIAMASYAALGREGVRRWLSLVRINEPRQEAWRMISLRGLLSLAHAPRALVLAALAALVAIFALRWRRAHELSLLISSAVVVGSLTSYHFYAYDAAVLLMPLSYLVLTPGGSSPEVSACAGSASEATTRAAAWPDSLVTLSLCASPLFFALSFVKGWALLCLPVLVLAAGLWRRMEK